MRIYPIVLAPLALASCGLPSVDATARYVNFEPEGEIAISSGAVTTSNQLSELGIADEEGTASLALDFKWGMPHLTINTQNTDWSGSGILNAELSSGGITLPIGTAVDSSLDLGITNALLTWDLAPTDLEIGLGFGVALLDLTAEFTGDPGTGVETVDVDESLPVPLLAARVGVDVGPLELHGYLAGLAAKVEDDEASYFDLDVHARWPIVGGQERLSGALVLGWRQVDIDVEVRETGDNADADLKFSGPYLGFQLSL